MGGQKERGHLERAGEEGGEYGVIREEGRRQNDVR